MIKYAIRISLPLLTLVLVTVIGPTAAIAHGNVSMEEDICVRKIGGNMVHFSAYQPQIEPKAQYCTEIPDVGDTFLVVDLVDPSLRTMPVGVKIIQGVNENEQDEAKTVAYWKPVSHPDGIVRGEATLEKGLYKLIITAEGLSPSTYLLRVQQADYSKLGRAALGPLALLLVLGVVGYELSKSIRVRGWFVSRRRS
ncbi:MAG: hypothetical protein OEV27_08820 [Nitrospira sp.]|nr:hypothetical protein [Nitrospira sp.]MDH4251278.1 hypothetical protein [Nitrospira sp.]MDH4344241.1 hypothetical protein [Nitrospira sp.]MDH5336802.1 hypothetical protein [Nitrospira sp.]